MGTKIDLREDEETMKKLYERRLKVLQYGDGVELAAQVGAVKYVECSALTQEGLKNVFEEAIRCVLGSKNEGTERKGTNRCIIN